jgi:hypothetical protein
LSQRSSIRVERRHRRATGAHSKYEYAVGTGGAHLDDFWVGREQTAHIAFDAKNAPRAGFKRNRR